MEMLASVRCPSFSPRFVPKLKVAGVAPERPLPPFVRIIAGDGRARAGPGGLPGRVGVGVGGPLQADLSVEFEIWGIVQESRT